MNISVDDFVQLTDYCLDNTGEFPEVSTYLYQFFATREMLGLDSLNLGLLFLKGYPYSEYIKAKPSKHNCLGYFPLGTNFWSRFLEK